ncbi:MAG: hypothetical protein H0T42_12965 [Deltaproteobacteria bacterium]|nr:hypothetical protein [Deltaproteobacteria bacterium]
MRTGNDVKATLKVAEEDSCSAGVDPFWYYEGVDLHDPTGIVTDHCMKLTMSRAGHKAEISPGRFVWREYLVSYDASY